MSGAVRYAGGRGVVCACVPPAPGQTTLCFTLQFYPKHRPVRFGPRVQSKSILPVFVSEPKFSCDCFFYFVCFTFLVGFSFKFTRIFWLVKICDRNIQINFMKKNLLKIKFETLSSELLDKGE